MLLRIGELAKVTGVTIRALRHYDEIGLLVPSARSEGGFRLYDQDDVARLYRIQALSRLNLPLNEIQRILALGTATFPDVIGQQIAFLDHQIKHATALREHLGELLVQLQQRQEPSMDDWLGTLARMSASAKYFSADDLQTLTMQRNVVGTKNDEEKASLIIELRRVMAEGLTADSAQAKDLASRWIALLLQEVGGDEGLLMKYYAMQWNEAALHSLSGVDRAGMTFISHAMAYRRLDIYARYCTRDEIAHLRRHYVPQTNFWPALISAIRDQMATGADPGCAEMRPLTHKWLALSSEKVGGDLQLAAKLQEAFDREEALRLGSGIDAPLLSYVRAAIHLLHQEQTLTHKAIDQ